MTQNMSLKIFIALLSVAYARPVMAEDYCYKAYWDGNDTSSFEKCVSAANSGDIESQHGYALILWSGHGRNPNRNESLFWFRSSAKSGHLMSQVALGRFLSSDETEPILKDYSEAYAWWALAGEEKALKELRSKMSEEQLTKAQVLTKEYLKKYKR